MANIDEMKAELGATVDYIRDTVTEKADTFEFDDNVALRDSLLAVAEEAKTAVALLEGELVTQLEAGVRQIGPRLFKRKRVSVKRFAHDSIRAAVGKWARMNAADETTGEVSVTKAVDHAMMAMAAIYVSPSTPAKVGAMERYDIEPKTVTEYEDRGWRLEVEQLDDRQD